MADILDKLTKLFVLILLLFVGYFFFTQFTQNKRTQKKIDEIESDRISLEQKVKGIQAATKSRDSILIDQQKGYGNILTELNKSIDEGTANQKRLKIQIEAAKAKTDSLGNELKKSNNDK